MALLNRLPVGEIHDQPWCPAFVRDFMTDFLQYAADRWEQYTPLQPILCRFLEVTGDARVIDLCSGGSGPWARLSGSVRESLERDFLVVLTDLYPNLPAFGRAREVSGGSVAFEEGAVDACAIPAHLSGFRTLFTSFHHFDAATAKAVLQDAVDDGEGIGIFEMTERSLGAVLAMVFTPLFVLLHAPRIRPFSWSRLFWTYLIPVVPLVVMVDGVASCLRSYTTEELAELTGSLSGAPYRWEIRRLKASKSPFPITYAIGCPLHAKASGANGPA